MFIVELGVCVDTFFSTCVQIWISNIFNAGVKFLMLHFENYYGHVECEISVFYKAVETVLHGQFFMAT